VAVREPGHALIKPIAALERLTPPANGRCSTPFAIGRHVPSQPTASG